MCIRLCQRSTRKKTKVTEQDTCKKEKFRRKSAAKILSNEERNFVSYTFLSK